MLRGWITSDTFLDSWFSKNFHWQWKLWLHSFHVPWRKGFHLKLLVTSCLLSNVCYIKCRKGEVIMPNKTDNQNNCWVISHMLRQSQLFVIQRALLFTKKDHTFSHAHKELHRIWWNDGHFVANMLRQSPWQPPVKKQSVAGWAVKIATGWIY